MGRLRHSYRRPLQRQQGAILAATLMLVFVLSLIATTAMQSAGLEGKLVRNYLDRSLSFQSAEAALRKAGLQLTEMTARPNAVRNCTQPPCVLEAALMEPGWWESESDDFWAKNGVQVGGAYYVIEEGPFVSDTLSVGHAAPTGRNFYTLTSRGMERNNTSRVVLQGAFVKRFN